MLVLHNRHTTAVEARNRVEQVRGVNVSECVRRRLHDDVISRRPAPGHTLQDIIVKPAYSLQGNIRNGLKNSGEQFCSQMSPDSASDLQMEEKECGGKIFSKQLFKKDSISWRFCDGVGTCYGNAHVISDKLKMCTSPFLYTRMNQLVPSATGWMDDTAPLPIAITTQTKSLGYGTSFDGEIIAISESLRNLLCHINKFENAVILSDSKAAILSIQDGAICYKYDYLFLTVARNVSLGQASPLSYAKGCSAYSIDMNNDRESKINSARKAENPHDNVVYVAQDVKTAENRRTQISDVTVVTNVELGSDEHIAG
ncbi:hypothetical protein ANN_18272 [Periplaneta americana]|uniref:Uncharacterized protein n=1 Tax=Periplaneta americana TaxID=6978 RepID=A0ABQ8SNA6_PERAM|nr:hypothetical protein ANN_18272 [Periplaneta americana]